MSPYFYEVVFLFHPNRMEKIGWNKYILAVMIFLCMSRTINSELSLIHTYSYTITRCYGTLSVKDYNYKIHHFPPNIYLTN